MQRINDSQFSAVLSDETTDVSHMSEMSFTVRYVHDSTVREDFIEFTDVHSAVYVPKNTDNHDTKSHWHITARNDS